MSSIESCVYGKLRSNDDEAMTAIDNIEWSIQFLKDAVEKIESANKNKDNPYWIDNNTIDIYMDIAKSDLNIAINCIKIAKM